MFKLHHLIEEHADELANLVVLENGKNKLEALASVSKANETVEWACSMPQIMQGKHQQVSRGITCSDERTPLGVVACVVPFNFPLMVPCWTLPIALASGNCVILKPSEKVPLTLRRLSELLTAAGVPPGVFQAVNGTAEVVTSLCDARDVSALTFVGSSYVAELVRARRPPAFCYSLHCETARCDGAAACPCARARCGVAAWLVPQLSNYPSAVRAVGRRGALPRIDSALLPLLPLCCDRLRLRLRLGCCCGRLRLLLLRSAPLRSAGRVIGIGGCAGLRRSRSGAAL
jgi:hypothetical protein